MSKATHVHKAGWEAHRISALFALRVGVGEEGVQLGGRLVQTRVNAAVRAIQCATHWSSARWRAVLQHIALSFLQHLSLGWVR
jgi:hypothetical protein